MCGLRCFVSWVLAGDVETWFMLRSLQVDHCLRLSLSRVMFFGINDFHTHTTVSIGSWLVTLNTSTTESFSRTLGLLEIWKSCPYPIVRSR